MSNGLNQWFVSLHFSQYSANIRLQASPRLDNELYKTFEQLATTPATDGTESSTRVIKRSDGRIGVVFETEDIRRMITPHQWLSSGCINGCAALFQALFSNQGEFAIFSTYTLVHIRSNVNDEVLWRNIRDTRYWKRAIWILPIHRETQSHWVLAILRPADGLIRVFDSFAQRTKSWSADIAVGLEPYSISSIIQSIVFKAIGILSSRLSAVAKKNGQRMNIMPVCKWTVQSILVSLCWMLHLCCADRN